LQAKLASAAPQTRVAELQRGFDQLAERLQRVEAESKDRLAAGLSVLAERYVNGRFPTTTSMSADERALIGQRMDEALTGFFRDSVPDKTSLSARRDSLRRLVDEMGDLRDELQRCLPDSTERMNPPLAEARHIFDELEDMTAAVASQKLHLRFEADFSTSSASRETLSEAIGAGLGDQIVKLQRPTEYFDRRIQSMALAASQIAADLIDRNAGGQRDGRLEAKLQTLLRAAGIENIAPSPGEPFRAGEHTVLQTRPSPDRSAANTVASLVTRGFRKDGRVFRRASIILYE
jgi:hypothetical protein